MRNKILVADSDNQARIALVLYLQAYGFQVWEAVDGDIASQLLTYEKFDLCIIDISIGGQQCAEVVAEARNIESSFPFIIMTAVESVEIEREARKLSPVFYCIKPVIFDDIKAVVERLSIVRKKKMKKETQIPIMKIL